MPNNSVSKFIEEHFYDQEYQGRWTKDGFKRLSTYLGNVEKGNSRVYTAPFGKGESIANVMSDWDSELVSIRDCWPTLYEFETDMRAKVGPLSVQKPLCERMADIQHYYDDILLPSEPVSPLAIKAVWRDFGVGPKLSLRSRYDTIEHMKLSSNSGNPYFTKRRNVRLEAAPSAVYAYDHSRSPGCDFELPDGTWGGCAVIGWRGQEGGPTDEDVKQRVVWMFPYSVNIEELRLYQPLIEQAQLYNVVPAWVSMDAVDDRITSLFDTKPSKDLVICTDFTRFDQHFNHDMQSAAETILYGITAHTKSVLDWLRDVFPIKYCIPLCYDSFRKPYWGCTYLGGYHGMASGSGGTNADETLVHRALQYEVAQMRDEDLNPNSMCLGDDGVLTFPGITVKDVVDVYSKHGQECNDSKQYASTQDCIYLRRWHHQDYRPNGKCAGVYSTMRAIGRLRYLERFMDPEFWSPEMVAIRQLSIIQNCEWHPMAEQFVRFCMKRDKYRLGLDIPNFLEDVDEYQKEAMRVMPDLLGYTKTLQGADKSPMSEWWVVKYLKSL